MELTEDQFVTQVMRHLFKSRGIDMSAYSQSFVLRSIKKRMGRSGASDYSSYLKVLMHGEEETSQLLAGLSINVTEFYRDKGAFETFSANVVRPLLISRSEGGGITRFWSAGCATGQETYTIAMCIVDELRRLQLKRIPLVSVLGTDISQQALTKAKSGFYTEEEVRGASKKALNLHFVRKGAGYEVSPEVSRLARFHRENLLDVPAQKYFDAIVCRNVLIYFSRQMHDVVTMNLFHALRQGGYLMLGKTETLMGAPRGSFDVVDLENRILRKKGAPVC